MEVLGEGVEELCAAAGEAAGGVARLVDGVDLAPEVAARPVEVDSLLADVVDFGDVGTNAFTCDIEKLDLRLITSYEPHCTLFNS